MVDLEKLAEKMQKRNWWFWRSKEGGGGVK